jgi:hypothetical protein
MTMGGSYLEQQIEEHSTERTLEATSILDV